MSLLLPHEGGGGGGGGCFDGEGVAAVGRTSNEGGAGAETSSANDAIDATTAAAVSADTAAAAAAAAAAAQGPGWWDVRNRDCIGRSEVQLAQGGIDGAASLLQVEAALRAGASLVEAMTPPPPLTSILPASGA